MSINIKRWLLFTAIGTALAVILVIAASFLLAWRARSEAARYLRVVTALPIGTTYDVVRAELRYAEIPMSLPSECQQECFLVFEVDDRWLYLLHLAPPVGFSGQLSFQDQRLTDKSTSMGYGVCCGVRVSETASAISGASSSSSLDTSRHPLKIHVDIAALDFTDYRKQAYAFDVTCIGSMRGCSTDEYLPTGKYLKQEAAK